MIQAATIWAAPGGTRCLCRGGTRLMAKDGSRGTSFYGVSGAFMFALCTTASARIRRRSIAAALLVEAARFSRAPRKLRPTPPSTISACSTRTPMAIAPALPFLCRPTAVSSRGRAATPTASTIGSRPSAGRRAAACRGWAYSLCATKMADRWDLGQDLQTQTLRGNAWRNRMSVLFGKGWGSSNDS